MQLDSTRPRATLTALTAVVVALAGCAISHRAQGGEPDASFDAPTMDVVDARPDQGGMRDVLDVPDAPDARPDVPGDQASCDASCDGGCANLATDVRNCGACGNDCTRRANVDANRVQCVAGACVVDGACTSDHADCNHSEADGCETAISAASNCGACGNVCSAGMPVCRPATGDAGGPAYVCDTGCAPGQLLCNGQCADTTNSAQHCGSCNQPCAAPANGSSTCVNSACVPACDPGFHLCNGNCFADSDPDHCGSTCIACPAAPNATVSCDGTTCQYACVAGYHGCTGGCVRNDSVSACGASSCSPCPGVVNGTPTCDGTGCDFTCNAGFHKCGSGCAADNDATQCGSACTACPGAANATGVCTGGSCDTACNAGFHKCAGACVSNDSTSSCGSSCAACSSPAHASATCDGTNCGYACEPGYADTGSACALPDACTGALGSSPVTIRLHAGDTVTVTGTTVGLADDFNSTCGGNGAPDAAFGVLADAGTLTATLQPSGFTGLLYWGLACGGSGAGCQLGASAGASVVLSGDFGFGFAGSLTVDGRNGSASGPFTLTLHLQ